MKTVYLDTTVPSYYYESRDDVIVRARKKITVSWWETQADHFHLFLSEFVLNELQRGNYPSQQNVLALVKSIPILPSDDEIREIAKIYIANKVMPRDESGDAVHLAFASYYKMDFLLTWNCRHLANANKVHHIKVVNMQMGLSTPEIVTPEQLFLEELP